MRLPQAIDEILRIESPLMASRRRTTCLVEVQGRAVDADERITLMWASANRDERVFRWPEEFRLDRDPERNLLYGAGIHVCPGPPLARLELRVLMEELLAAAEFLPQRGRSSDTSPPTCQWIQYVSRTDQRSGEHVNLRREV